MGQMLNNPVKCGRALRAFGGVSSPSAVALVVGWQLAVSLVALCCGHDVESWHPRPLAVAGAVSPTTRGFITLCYVTRTRVCVCCGGWVAVQQWGFP